MCFGVFGIMPGNMDHTPGVLVHVAVRPRCMRPVGVRMCFGVFVIMPGNIDRISGELDVRICSAARRGVRWDTHEFQYIRYHAGEHRPHFRRAGCTWLSGRAVRGAQATRRYSGVIGIKPGKINYISIVFDVQGGKMRGADARKENFGWAGGIGAAR